MSVVGGAQQLRKDYRIGYLGNAREELPDSEDID